MLVVVYLRDAKRYTIVPEEFVYVLNERALKNRGLNRNQNRLIYFSSEVFQKLQQNEIPYAYAPNFSLQVSTEYPLPDNLEATCFIGRLISFEETFEAAMVRANRLRERMPAIYNAARVSERPIPLVEPIEAVNQENHFENMSLNESNASNDPENADPDEENARAENHSVPESTLSNLFEENDANVMNHSNSSVSIALQQSIDTNLPVIEQNNEAASGRTSSENVSGDAPQVIVKQERSSIVVNAEDVAALENLFNNCDQTDDSNAFERELDTPNSIEFAVSMQFESTRVGVGHVDTVASTETQQQSEHAIPGIQSVGDIQPGPSNESDNVRSELGQEDEQRAKQIETNLKEVLLNGEKVIVDDEIEFIHLPNQVLKAIIDRPEYRTKSNNPLCGNRPFIENEKGDRGFMIAKGADFEEVWISAHAVKGLEKMQKQNDGAEFDSIYLKALIVGLCTMEKIRVIDAVDEHIAAFIKELFEWRVGASRIGTFDQLFQSAFNALKMLKLKP